MKPTVRVGCSLSSCVETSDKHTKYQPNTRSRDRVAFRDLATPLFSRSSDPVISEACTKTVRESKVSSVRMRLRKTLIVVIYLVLLSLVAIGGCVLEFLFYSEPSRREYQKEVVWPTDQTPYEQQLVELHERQCSLRLIDENSEDPRSQDLLSGVYRDARLIFPFRVENTMYWKVVPHPCSESVTIEARLNGDGHGFESLYKALLRDAPRKKIVVDVGANLGGYTIFPAVLGFRVVSVEIQQERVREIQLMAKLNGVDSRVQVFHAAVHERTGGTMMCDDQRPQSVLVANCKVSSVLETQQSAHTALSAPLHSMDDILKSSADVYMYKVDCDGCEKRWFEGSMKFLERSGSKVPFYLLEASAHEEWFVKFDLVLGNTRRWYCTLYSHGAKRNPQTINYEALMEAVRSKDLERATAIAPVYKTLADLRSALSDVWDENFPREYRRSDILVIHVDRI